MKTEPNTPGFEQRREFLRSIAAVGVALAGCATAPKARPAGASADVSSDKHEEAEVTPGEDLMQEHGVLERILLVYDEVVRRIARAEAFDPALLTNAAGIVRRFVEDYHEKTEEQFVFPRLAKTAQYAGLVATLQLQHQRGREVTDEIVKLAGSVEVAPLLQSFTRMYRPHAAREDTVLFPAFREVVGRAAYAELGERFEEGEHRLLGEHGFEDAVGQVAGIEAALGIADLAAFTP
jgi:hemerythrin-like domain-containing protein